MGTVARVAISGAREVEALLEGLARVCAAQIAAGAVRVPLFSSGVRYEREPAGRERWQSARETLRRKAGDCEDLVAWRVAELRARGDNARPLVYQPRPGLLHCVVRRGDGSIECPSRILGMSGNG